MAGIPRRCSVYDDDFDPSRSAHWVVALDGNVQTHVIAFDIDAGTVTRHQLNERGEVQLDESGENKAVETVHGVVTVNDAQSPAQPED